MPANQTHSVKIPPDSNEQDECQPLPVKARMAIRKTDLSFKMRLIFWVLGAVLAFAQAWFSRFQVWDNTISYLDMGNYFFHGHYASIINGFWAPVCAFLLGLTMTLFRPSLYWEYPTVHLVMFLMFLFTMACFDYFLRQVMQFGYGGGPSKKNSGEQDWAWITIGYTLFLWSSLQLIGLGDIDPEMLVAGLFYLACGLLVAIYVGRASWKEFLALGVAIGLSYLTKSAVLPICLLILLIAWLSAKQKARYVMISAITFVAIAAPFIAALSSQKGRFAWGESIKYDYAVSVNRIPHIHWQGGALTPAAHPTRELFAAPATYEFREPFQGTFPPEYDISYWYEGVKPQFHLRRQLEVLRVCLLWEFETLFRWLNGVLLTTLFLVLYETGRGWRILKDFLRYWFLIIPTLFRAIFHAMVYYHPNYLAASFVVLLLCLFLSAAPSDSLARSRLLSGVAVLQCAVFFCLVGLPLMLDLFNIHPLHARAAEKATYPEIAQKASEMGLRPGDEIASLNYSNTSGLTMWAHLAHAQIIAEVHSHDTWQPEEEAESFWKADPLTQEKIMQKLSQTGARAVISQDKPSGAGAEGWLEIGTTGYYLYWLKPAEAPRTGTPAS